MQSVTFDSEGKKLSGALYKAPNEEAALLILAGGANICHQEGWYPFLQEHLAAEGITSMAFDYRGVGQSEGNLNETTINSRIEDSKNALMLLKASTGTNRFFLMGQSLGAPVALAMACSENPDGLILVVPAAYSSEARTKPFGPEFSAEIRRPDGWKNSPEFERLKEFKGRVLLAFGTLDEVVPRGIYELYREILIDRGQVLEYMSSGHKFAREPDSVSSKARELLQKSIRDFIL